MFFKKKPEEEASYQAPQNNFYEIRYANLESKYENIKKAKDLSDKEYKRLKGMSETLCKNVMSNDYNLNQLGGNSILKGLDIYKLIDFTMTDYQKQKIQEMESMRQMADQIKMQGIIIESLKNQLKQVIAQGPQDISDVDIENSEIIDNTNMQPPVRYERDNRGNSEKIETEISSPSKLTLESVDTYMSSMTEVMWDILEAIGKSGVAKSNEISDYVFDILKRNYNRSNVQNSLGTLKKMNILSAEQVSTGFKRFQIFKFTQKGLEMYRSYFKSEPVESEIDKIIRDHDNIIHGYTIKDAAELLIAYYECTDAIMDRDFTSVKLEGGKTYIPDIIATKKDGKKMYVEVELGNTPQKDFNDKCKKMLEVTKEVYIVTDVDEKLKSKLESQVSMFILAIGGKDKVQGVTFYLTTMTQLSKGEFSKIMQY